MMSHQPLLESGTEKVLKMKNENEDEENLYKTKKAPLPEGPNYYVLCAYAR